MNMTTTWNNPPPLNSLHPLINQHHHLPGDHGSGAGNINVGSSDLDQQQQQEASINRRSSSSLRWNPTAEQLLALEELYRRGIRTPTATQIHHVAARLRRFGNIQPKNVFYWFQNHKARERQKRRRLTALLDHTNNNRQYTSTSSSNNNLIITSKNLENGHHSVLMRRSEGHKVEQARRCRVRGVNCSKMIQRNERWELSSSAICSTASPTTVSVCKTKSQDVNGKVGDEETAGGDDQTLELFPVKAINNARKEDTKRSFPSSCSTPNYQYIEFLPVKK